jgi:nitronate monooxygenase
MWPDRRLLDLLNIEHPIIQAPMAGVQDWALVAAVSEAGGLGSLPCAMLGADKVREEAGKIRARTRKFDAALCDAVVDIKPAVASFHFGLPEPALLKRVKDVGCVVLASATTVAEARWLEERGADAVIAQGVEAGGHRGIFLSDDISTQVGTMALVPQVADAVKLPVIAAGGIADARGIAAAFALGAAGVQIGSAFLHCPEAKLSVPHRAALKSARDDGTALTNLLTSRPARGFVTRLMREEGPMSDAVPEFSLAAIALAPLRAKAEAEEKGDFSPLWSGEAAALGRELPAAEVLHRLAQESRARMREISRAPKEQAVRQPARQVWNSK